MPPSHHRGELQCHVPSVKINPSVIWTCHSVALWLDPLTLSLYGFAIGGNTLDGYDFRDERK